MKKFDLMAMQKKGSITVNSTVDKALGVTLVIVLLAALAPTMFGTNWSEITGAPAFVGIIMPILIAFVIVYAIYKFVK